MDGMCYENKCILKFFIYELLTAENMKLSKFKRLLENKIVNFPFQPAKLMF